MLPLCVFVERLNNDNRETVVGAVKQVECLTRHSKTKQGIVEALALKHAMLNGA